MAKNRKKSAFPRDDEPTPDGTDTWAPETSVAGPTIEPAAPVPPVTRSRKSKYPWESLEIARKDSSGELVGNWFRVAGTTTKKFSTQVYAAARRLGRKFTVRQIEDGVLGVWRLA